MSTPFQFQSPGRIAFGCGESRRLGGWAAAMGRKAVVLTGAHGERWSGLLTAMEAQGLKLARCSIGSEPTVAVVEALREQARGFGADLMVAIGGGSVIDAGKALAAMVVNPGPILDYLEVIGAGRALDHPPLPLIAVPTTAGTGAEATCNAVILSETHRLKVSLRSPLMMPRLAVVDPELTVSMPPRVTAATGLDALTQLLEAFVARRANPLTDGLCREGLKQVARGLERAWSQGHDLEARAAMALASLFGGLALANAGLGAVHGIAGPLGGMLGAPHGMVCGRLLPFVMAANVKALRARDGQASALARYREAAGLLSGKPQASTDDGVAWVQALSTRLAVPPLSALGLSAGTIPEAAERAQRASSMRGNPVELTAAEVAAILHAAL